MILHFKYSQPSLILAGKAGAHSLNMEAQLRLDIKLLLRTNTLAYFAAVSYWIRFVTLPASVAQLVEQENNYSKSRFKIQPLLVSGENGWEDIYNITN